MLIMRPDALQATKTGPSEGAFVPSYSYAPSAKIEFTAQNAQKCAPSDSPRSPCDYIDFEFKRFWSALCASLFSHLFSIFSHKMRFSQYNRLTRATFTRQVADFAVNDNHSQLYFVTIFYIIITFRYTFCAKIIYNEFIN